MENKIMFLLIAIILVFALFSKTGTASIKALIGIVQTASTATSAATNITGEGTVTQAPTSKGGNGNSAGSGANTSPSTGTAITGGTFA